MIEVLRQSLTFASCLMQLGIEDSVFNLMEPPMGKARRTPMFFHGIRRSIPSYAQGFGGLSSLHSSTAIGRAWTPKCPGVSARRRGLLRRRINYHYRIVALYPIFLFDGGSAVLSACAEDHACVQKRQGTSACRHGLCPWGSLDDTKSLNGIL